MNHYIAGNWASSSVALTLPCGACGALLYTLSSSQPLSHYAIFPSPFRVQVEWVSQRCPSQPLLPKAGIERGADVAQYTMVDVGGTAAFLPAPLHEETARAARAELLEPLAEPPRPL